MGDTRWTDDQQRVIDARNCNLLVSAAAGSGKTAVLVERIIKMITDEKNNVEIAGGYLYKCGGSRDENKSG